MALGMVLSRGARHGYGHCDWLGAGHVFRHSDGHGPGHGG